MYSCHLAAVLTKCATPKNNTKTFRLRGNHLHTERLGVGREVTGEEGNAGREVTGEEGIAGRGR